MAGKEVWIAFKEHFYSSAPSSRGERIISDIWDTCPRCKGLRVSQVSSRKPSDWTTVVTVTAALIAYERGRWHQRRQGPTAGGGAGKRAEQTSEETPGAHCCGMNRSSAGRESGNSVTFQAEGTAWRRHVAWGRYQASRIYNQPPRDPDIRTEAFRLCCQVLLFWSHTLQLFFPDDGCD